LSKVIKTSFLAAIAIAQSVPISAVSKFRPKILKLPPIGKVARAATINCTGGLYLSILSFEPQIIALNELKMIHVQEL